MFFANVAQKENTPFYNTTSVWSIYISLYYTLNCGASYIDVEIVSGPNYFLCWCLCADLNGWYVHGMLPSHPFLHHRGVLHHRGAGALHHVGGGEGGIPTWRVSHRGQRVDGELQSEVSRLYICKPHSGGTATEGILHFFTTCKAGRQAGTELPGAQ